MILRLDNDLIINTDQISHFDVCYLYLISGERFLLGDEAILNLKRYAELTVIREFNSIVSVEINP